LLTGERNGYYEDYGRIHHLARAYRQGFVYTWRYSRHRQRFHGSSTRGRRARQFVVCSQNHDQVGNRLWGERLGELVDFESLKLEAGALLLSPFVPMLFMGQEYRETAPFQYFTDYTDEDVAEAVRDARHEAFGDRGPDQECPNPQSVETFMKSKLHWELREDGRHQVLLAFYKRLLELRSCIPHVVSRKGLTVQTIKGKDVLILQRTHGRGQVHCLMNFSDRSENFALCTEHWNCLKILDSAETQWDGLGAELPKTVHDQQTVTMPPRSIALYRLIRPDLHSDRDTETSAPTSEAQPAEAQPDDES